MSKEIPEPSITEFIAFGLVVVLILTAIGTAFDSTWLVLIGSAVAGWNARHIIHSIKRGVSALLIKLNEWSKK